MASRRLVLSSFSDFCLFILSRVVFLEHDLRSTMSSQKPGKIKQKSLLPWVKPQDTKARVEDENVEKSFAAEIMYQREVLKAARIMLLLSLLKQLVPSYLY